VVLGVLFVLELPLAIVSHELGVVRGLKIFGALFPIDLEAVDAGHEDNGRLFGHHVGVGLQEDVREGAAEVGSVDVGAFLFGDIHVLALRAKHLHPGVSEVLGHTDGQHILAAAQDSWTHSEGPVEELFSHDCLALRRLDKSIVDQSVKVHRFLVNVQESYESTSGLPDHRRRGSRGRGSY
jgi:hypothetical protein